MNISPKENIRMAMSAVWTHRFRSFLTILGIVIGITTVVCVASLLTGLRAGIVTFFQSLGPDNIFLSKTDNPGAIQDPPKQRKRRQMEPDYADLIKRYSSTIEDVATELIVPPAASGTIITAKVPGYDTDNLQIVGVTANDIVLVPHDFDEGRYFTEEEEMRSARVAVLGYDIGHVLFPQGNAVGRTFMMDGAEYTVVGVSEKAKGGFLGENGQDTVVEIPLSTARSRYPQLTSWLFVCKAKEGMRKDARDDIEAIMRRIRHVKTGDPDDFSIQTPDQIMQQIDQVTGLVGLIAIAISALGLLVGGIGVMNIMLVSVTERTREIGVRKALGARRMDIIGQFLVEAMALTSSGGLLGILFAVAISTLIGALVPSLPSAIPAWAVVTALLASMAIGIFFGTWPAVKAARLDPVEALRYE